MPNSIGGPRRPAAPVLRIAVAGLALALISATVGGPAHARPAAQSSFETPSAVGATLESVLAIARKLSPELMARALDNEAAQAKVMIAGSLPDPQFQAMSDENRSDTGARQNMMIYSFEQDIPLWGRRGLKRDIARAEVGQTQALARNADAELTERVRVAFARYYAAYQSVHRTQDLHGAMSGIAAVARARYGQGRGEQAEVFRAEVDTTRVATDVVRLETNLNAAKGRLNALLLRPAEAPLASPARLPPLPDGASLNGSQLLLRARQANPAIAADSAALHGAELNRKLADKTWYPDVTVGAAAIQRQGWGPPGYRAWVGVKIPLQWGLHEGEIRQAAAQAQAAQARLDVREQQIESDLSDAVASFQGSRRTADLIRRQLLPQAEAAVRSGAAAYGVDRTDLASVLRSEHDLSDIRLQLLAAEFDSQRALAAIERLIGGDL